MATTITRDIIESYLNCKYKGHLKLAGESRTPSDYERITATARQVSREQAVAGLVARFGEGDTGRGETVTAAILRQGAPLLVDVDLGDEGLSFRCEALKRAGGPSKLGNHYYVPVLHNHTDKVDRRQKVLLAVFGILLGRVQGLRPATGLFIRGVEGRLGKVQLDAKLYRRAEQVVDEIKRLQEGGEPPRLMLNSHCQQCEFRQRCRKQAEEADDISLLQTVGEKELRKLSRKGIFTLTQLSCTFRPRKRGKRVKRRSYNRYAALQALAIRERKVHVYGIPDLPRKPVQVFFDAEGVEDGSFAYLLGVIVVEGDTTKMHSFWADSPAEEVQVFDAFLDLLESREDFALFHFGSYEKTLLKRMGKVVTRKQLVNRVLGNTVNVLSVIHASVYFPTFSNGLKEVGRYLGCNWKEESSSGLQSLVWRAWWEQTKDQCWKDRLFVYNAEDCVALRKVTECIQAIGDAARSRSNEAGPTAGNAAVAWADEIAVFSSRREFCQPRFVLQEFDHVNRCAYFDYQREKVFLRTSKVIRRACTQQGKRRRGVKLAPNWEVEIREDTCPFCKGTHVTWLRKQIRVRFAYDLKFTAGGIRRQVIRCKSARHECEDCHMRFLPERYRRRDKHLHGLKSWAMYQHVIHRVSLEHLEAMFEDCFALRVGLQELLVIKALLANRYRATWQRILDRIVGGQLAHADETHVNLKRVKGYVWILTNLEDVVYMYRPSREADFLQALLKDFNGVLVSDFYSGYDSLPCYQQKCLVHLLRDFNADLMSSPYDEEFKALAGEFGKLLRLIVDTIDKHGLKKCHLHRHKTEVSRFFRDVESCVYRSELAENYQKRLLKYEGKLFTFLDHDGVPWNNNNAENAVKAFAHYRRDTDGMLSEQGLSDYLVLQSIYQTCKYRGVSFLKFLLSGEADVEEYCRQRRRKKRLPILEVYPEGFPRACLRKRGNEDRKDERNQEP